jgi:DNA-3-methyladenine glycosylase I
MVDNRTRCFGSNSQIYADYHDNEWGKPVYDDSILFEFLILEGAQAGLSWETVLKKREGYRRAFYGFDPVKVANMSDDELEDLRLDTGIIRNRLKIYSARKNALSFLEIQKEYGSFAKFIWQFVDNKPIVNRWDTKSDMPVTTSLSDKISKELKLRGMSFVGSTIIYSYMQAVGLVNDHLDSCWVTNNSSI